MNYNKKDFKDKIEVQVINNERSLDELETKWDIFASKCKNPSIFSSFIFVRTAWKHFHNSKRDQLFILLIKRNSEIIAIAPFRIEIQNVHSVPIRSIRMIPEWNGDRPRIVSCEDENTIWDIILKFLKYDFKDWDILNLAETECNVTGLNHNCIGRIRYHYMIEPETVSYCLTNYGLDNYRINLSKKTENKIKYKERKLSHISPNVEFQCYQYPEDIQDALSRFIAIEQSGWKKGKPFAVGGIKVQKDFNHDLILQLANRKMVSIYLMSVDGEDISARIVYHYNEYSYLANTTYNQKFSTYSPGVILKKKVVESILRNGQCKEIDMLGLQIKYGDQQLKQQFATRSIKTYRVRIQKRNMRWLIINLKKIKTWMIEHFCYVTKKRRSSHILTN